MNIVKVPVSFRNSNGYSNNSYGYSDGSGHGHGYGYGYGNGYGCGYGNSHGHGNGSGYSNETFHNKETIDTSDELIFLCSIMEIVIWW